MFAVCLRMPRGLILDGCERAFAASVMSTNNADPLVLRVSPGLCFLPGKRAAGLCVRGRRGDGLLLYKLLLLAGRANTPLAGSKDTLPTALVG